MPAVISVAPLLSTLGPSAMLIVRGRLATIPKPGPALVSGPLVARTLPPWGTALLLQPAEPAALTPPVFAVRPRGRGLRHQPITSTAVVTSRSHPSRR
jgi:hypothetical protein